MEEITIEKLKNFFESYHRLENKFWTTRLGEEKSDTNLLFNGYKDLSNRLAPILAEEAPEFNVFKILNICHYEAWVHTPFLCNLLNPKGSHQQRELFLDTFLQNILNLKVGYGQFSGFEIYEEFPIANGRIDLLMRYNYAGKKYGIVIENKIYAQDQKSQLFRYYDYLKTILKIEKENIHIVYLSPWAIQPSDDSLEIIGSEKVDEELRAHLKIIGYHRDIIPWLISVSNNILSPAVKHTVYQYIKTLHLL